MHWYVISASVVDLYFAGPKDHSDHMFFVPVSSQRVSWVGFLRALVVSNRLGASLVYAAFNDHCSRYWTSVYYCVTCSQVTLLNYVEWLHALVCSNVTVREAEQYGKRNTTQAVSEVRRVVPDLRPAWWDIRALENHFSYFINQQNSRKIYRV
jgi:hypothetical protein